MSSNLVRSVFLFVCLVAASQASAVAAGSTTVTESTYPGTTAAAGILIHTTAVWPATDTLTITASLPPGATSFSVRYATCSGTTCTIAVANLESVIVLVGVQSSVPAGTRLVIPIHISSATGGSATTPQDVTLVITVTEPIDIALSIVAAPATVLAGTTTPLTVRIENRGAYPAPAFGFRMFCGYDGYAPAATGYTATHHVSGPAVTCNDAAPVEVEPVALLTCHGGMLAPGESAVVVVDYYVDPFVLTTQRLSVQADLTSPDDLDMRNNVSQAEFAVTARAEVQAAVTAPATASVGDYVTARLTAVNHGPSNTGWEEMTYDMPANAEFVSLRAGAATMCTTPAPGQTGRVVCRGPVWPDMPYLRLTAADVAPTIDVGMRVKSAGTLIHHVSVGPSTTEPYTSSTPDPVLSNNSASATTLVTAGPTSPADVALTTSLPGGEVPANQPYSYTLTVTNVGDADASGVVLTDVLPPEAKFVSSSVPCSGTTTITCSLGTIAAHASVPVTMTLKAPDGNLSLLEQASITAANDTHTANNAVTSTVWSRVPELDDVGVAIWTPEPLRVNTRSLGAVVIALSNTASVSAELTLTVKLPPGLHGRMASVPDAKATPASDGGTLLSARLRVKARATTPQLQLDLTPERGTPAGTVFPIHAEVRGTAPDPNPANDVADVPVTLAAPEDNPRADVSVALDLSSDHVAVGDTVTAEATGFPVTAKRVEASTLTVSTGALIIDSVVSSGRCSINTRDVVCYFDAFDVGTTSPAQYPRVRVIAHAIAPGAWYVDANFNADYDEFFIDDNYASRVLTVTPASNAATDLQVTTAGNELVLPGGTTTQTVTIANRGSDAADSVDLMMAVSRGLTWQGVEQLSGPSFDCRPPSGSDTILCTTSRLLPHTRATFRATAVADGTETTAQLAAQAATSTRDTDASNDGAVAPIEILSGVDLAVTMTPSASIAAPLAHVLYDVRTTNRGSAPAHDVRVTIALPAGATLVRATPSTGTCSVTPLVCQTDVLGANDTLAITVEATMPSANTVAVATASASARELDHDPDSNSATAEVSVGLGRRRSTP